MSSKETAIKLENISKLYRIGMKDEMQDSFARTIFDFIKSPLRNYRKYRSLYRFDDIDPNSDSNSNANSSDIIWALKDVSFELKKGEVLGIIGRNGAGKSTLLKILSLITNPTSGQAKIRGRVSSLLEVGTGFHQELTGRENVYLNGTILGMKKKEVDKKFDKIVYFSGVEKFIDTPVKRYSSGMKMRLAFSVASFLEPEILIIDEVLSVGDAEFQKKCLNKMETVGQEGRTVLFVSHNLAAVSRLCSRTIWLDQGRIIADGPTKEIISQYLHTQLGVSAICEWSDITTAPGSDIARLRAVRIKNEKGSISPVIDIREPFVIEMEIEVFQSGHWLLPNFNLYNEEDIWIFTTMDQDPKWRRRPRPSGCYISSVSIPGNLLAEGTIFVEPAMMTPEPSFIKHFREPQTVAFRVVDSLDGDSARGDYHGDMPGVVRPLLKWDTQFIASNNSEKTIVVKQKG